VLLALGLRLPVSLSTPKGTCKSQSRDCPEIKSEEDETTDGHGVESGGFEEVGGFG